MALINRDGMVIEVESTTRTGKTVKPIRNPAVALMHQFEKAMLTSAAKFGLDPHSPSRIEIPQEAEDDPSPGGAHSFAASVGRAADRQHALLGTLAAMRKTK